MKPEIEAKFIGVEHEQIRNILRGLGAECVQPKRLMKRHNYDFADKRLERDNNGWVRLRDEGDKTTLSYKQLNERSLDGMQEACVEVTDYVAADTFLVAIGLQASAYQESYRESWELDGVQIELDEWPWIKPFIEIEGPDEAAVRKVADQLGLQWSQALHGSVEVIYRKEYDVTDQEIYDIDRITFIDTPEWLESRRLTV